MANIRTARRSGLVLRGGRMRRQSLWGNMTTAKTSIGTSQTAVLSHSLNSVALNLRPFTVVRVRLHWFVRSDVVTGGEIWGGAVGVCMVSDQASAIGVTAVPTPVTDQGSDLWFVFDAAYGRFGGTAVEEVGLMRDVDSRAMRKVEEGQDMITVQESGIAATSISMDSVLGGRFLIKLH